MMKIQTEQEKTFKNECVKLFYRQDFNLENSLLITHYTSPVGFMGIIESKKLWATRYDCLNDITERKDVQKIYNLVINDLIKKDSFYEKFKDIEINGSYNSLYYSELLGFHSKTIENPEVFIISFSKDEDSLSMWNYYTKNDKYNGYALTFEKSDYQYYNCNPSLYIKCSDLIYDDREKYNQLKSLFESIKSIYVDSEDCLRFARSLISNLLFQWGDSFKNSHFQHEEEHRIIIVQDKNERVYEVKTREKDGLIIPYIEFPLDDFLTLTSVTCAPLHNDELALQLTKEYLSKNESYKNVIVQSSEVPIRY